MYRFYACTALRIDFQHKHPLLLKVFLPPFIGALIREIRLVQKYQPGLVSP